MNFTSLRGKLLLFSFALVVVPGLVFGFIAYDSARGALQEAVGRMLAEVAHDTAGEVNDLLRRESWSVRTWAQQDLMRELGTPDGDHRIARFLASLRESDVGYVELMSTDVAGRVMAATAPVRIGEMEGEQDWHRVVAQGEDYLAGPLTIPGYTSPVLVIASPIFDTAERQRRIGALLGWYDWDRVVAITRNIRKNSSVIDLDVDVALLDEGGTVIAHAGDTFDAVAGRNLRAAGWIAAQRPLQRKRPGYVREATVAALVGYARMKGKRPSWVSLVAQQPRQALAPIYRMRTKMRWLLTGVLVSALGIATLLADRVSRPLRALTAATKEISRAGAMRQPVTVRSHDEIGELAAAFNAMADDLKVAQAQLVMAEKYAFVGEVAAGVAHEVRTPLGILRSSAQILGRSIGADQPKEFELIEMMIGEVDRLDRVVAGLLEVARPRELLLGPTRLTPVLARVLDFADAQARARNLTVQRFLAAEQAPALCDPEQLYQVALNLIVNALQVLPSGGVLTVRSVSNGDARVGFEVTDSGPGIPPEVLKHIFTPFYTQRSGGTGLGLALALRVIQAQGGTLSVESKVGEGSTFRVELPVAEVA